MDHNLKITVSETIYAPVDQVWNALTNKEMIRQYFFGTEVDSDWQPGSPITFTGEWEDQSYREKGTILENRPEKRLKYNYWSSMGGLSDVPENYAIITYELDGNNAQTMLTISQEGFRDQQAYDDSIKGWKTVLSNLKGLIGKQHG